MDKTLHTGKQTGVASPQVIAVAVRHEHVGLEGAADGSEAQDRCNTWPTRHGKHADTRFPKLLDTHGIDTQLASQHEQWLDATTGECSPRQCDRDLGCAAGESSGDEMQDANRRSGGQTSSRSHAAGRMSGHHGCAHVWRPNS